MQNQCSPRKFSFGIKKTLHYPYKVRWHLGNPFWITLKNHQTSTSLLWMLQSIYNYYVNHKVVLTWAISYGANHCVLICFQLKLFLQSWTPFLQEFKPFAKKKEFLSCQKETQLIKLCWVSKLCRLKGHMIHTGIVVWFQNFNSIISNSVTILNQIILDF